jgi:hypothetical protein
MDKPTALLQALNYLVDCVAWDLEPGEETALKMIYTRDEREEQQVLAALGIQAERYGVTVKPREAAKDKAAVAAKRRAGKPRPIEQPDLLSGYL